MGTVHDYLVSLPTLQAAFCLMFSYVRLTELGLSPFFLYFHEGGFMPEKPKRKTRKELSDEHEGHENHLCELVRNRQMVKVAELSRDAKYMCQICGRAAKKAENLCHPVEI